MQAPIAHRRLDNPDDRLRLTFEIAAVIALGAMPFVLFALTDWLFPRSPKTAGGGRPDARAYAGIVTSLQILVPLLYIFWRTGRPWAKFGIVRIHPTLDVVIALACVAFMWVGYFIIDLVFGRIAWFVPFFMDVLDAVPPPPGVDAEMRHETVASALWLYLVWMLLNALTEELVTKSYLIPRLRDFTGSTTIAVLASSAIFASYHIYHGSYSMTIIFIQHALLGVAFVKLGRVWPFVLGHALYDIALRYAA